MLSVGPSRFVVREGSPRIAEILGYKATLESKVLRGTNGDQSKQRRKAIPKCVKLGWVGEKAVIAHAHIRSMRVDAAPTILVHGADGPLFEGVEP